MFDLISILLIFLEKSMAIDTPYNFVAVTYITYLVYTKGVDAFFNILLVALVVSLNSISLSTSVGVVSLYFVVFYFLSTYMGYKKINLPFITIIQVVLYLVLLYVAKIDSPSITNVVKYFIAYGVFNYLYIEDAEKNLGAR